VCGREHLLPRFNRTRASDDNDAGSPNLNTANIYHRALGSRLSAHKLKRLGDGDDVFDARRDPQGFNFMSASGIPDYCDNRTGCAAGYMGLETGLRNALNDVLNLLFRGLL
jgi:hypothetical protein